MSQPSACMAQHNGETRGHWELTAASPPGVEGRRSPQQPTQGQPTRCPLPLHHTVTEVSGHSSLPATGYWHMDPPTSCKHKNCVLPGLLPALTACKNNPGSCRRTLKPGAVRKAGKVRGWVSSLQQHGHRPHSSLLCSHVELLSVHTVPLGMQPGVLARTLVKRGSTCTAAPSQENRGWKHCIPPAAWGREPGW